jgi:hypothetical protein
MAMLRLLIASAIVSCSSEMLFGGFEYCTDGDADRLCAVVSDEQLLKSPAWKNDAPNPPFSAKAAIRLATDLKQKLVKDSKTYTWRFESAKLCRDQYADRWYWTIQFETRFRPGAPPDAINELDLVVLMDGTVIQPVVPKKPVKK